MAHRKNLDDGYEFRVERMEEYDGEFLGYSVSLPHQCDSWEILGAEKDENGNENYLSYPKSKEAAIRQMELFIKSANQALVELYDLK